MPAPSSQGPARTRRAWRALLVTTLVAAAGCAAPDEAPRQSLRALAAEAPPPATATPSSPAAAAHPVVVVPRAREALDRGNAAFRRHDYPAALRDYRAAAEATPASAAPYFGVYMVARKVGNPALADSAMREISRLSGTTLTTPEVEKLHRAPAGAAQVPR